MSVSDSLIVSRLRAAGCVFAEDEARLLMSTARTPDELAAMVDRRVAGLPLEQVLGWAEFCGLRIIVAPGVFVPRRRTEFLVRQAALLIRGDDPSGPPNAPVSPGGTHPPGPPLGGTHPPGPPLGGTHPPGPPLGGTHPPGPPLGGTHPPGPPRADEGLARPGVVIVDLCCGAGAIGAALTAAVDRAEVHAADIDPAAVRCARRNLPGPRGHVYQGDLYEPLPGGLRGRVAILVANVPYVPTGEIGFLPPEARAYEPRVALDGGADGLDVLRRVAAEAPEWLAPGGHLLIEISERQVPSAQAAFVAGGLAARVASSADLDATVVIGRLLADRGT